MTITIKKLLNITYKQFYTHKFFHYADTELILQKILKTTKIWLLLNDNIQLSIFQINLFNKLIKQRLLGKPLEYILHKVIFWSLPLYINQNVFIPRVETELLVSIAIEKINYHKKKIVKLLELGTGSGAISIAIAYEHNNCQILATDYNNIIIRLAQYNAKNLLINNIIFKKSNWFYHIPKQLFDIIISNPPYIDNQDIYYQHTNINFEPNSALLSKANGLFDLAHIITNANNWLNHCGWLILEHGWYQAAFIQTLLKLNKFINIVTIKDFNGNNRVTLAQKINL